MNQDQLLSLLRTILQVIGTAVVTHGTLGINGAMWEQISGAVIIIAPTIWSMYEHTDAANIAKVTAMPDVAKIVPRANADPSSAIAIAATDSSQPKVAVQIDPSNTL
jgi:hypothetical protein